MTSRPRSELKDLAPVLGHVSPFVSVSEALALFCVDKGMRTLAELTCAPLDAWAQPMTLGQVTALLRRFMVLDGAVNLSSGADVEAVSRLLPVGGLRHLACGALPYEAVEDMPPDVARPRLLNWLPAEARPNLRTVDLGGCRSACDLQVLEGCHNLVAVAAKRVVARHGVLDLGPVGRCDRLEHLSVGGVVHAEADDSWRWTGGGPGAPPALPDLAPLAKLSRLTHLSLPARHGAGAGCFDPEPLLDLPLEHLEWVGTVACLEEAHGSDRRRLALDTLRHVGVMWATDLQLTFALHLPKLRSLHLKSCKLAHEPAALGVLVGCDDLDSVALEACTGVADLAPLAACEKLRHVIVDVEPGTAKPSLAPFAHCANLESLAIKGYRSRVAHTLFVPPPAFAALRSLSVTGLGYTAFANEASASGAFPNLAEFNGADADEVRMYESARVNDHNRRYCAHYAKLRESGLAPKAAMAAAADFVGELIVPTCSPKRSPAFDRPPGSFEPLPKC